MTQPEPLSQPTPPQITWWQRNRLPLVLLPPLVALALAASSFRLSTLYLPNEYSRPQRAVGQSLGYHESFTRNRHLYRRDLTLTLTSLKASPSSGHEQAARGATLWTVELKLEAAPEVPLMDCRVALLDGSGVLYDDQSGQYSTATEQPSASPQDRCVPPDTPGPDMDFTGQLIPGQGTRPASWRVQRTVAMPQGRQPAYVRVAWNPPHYALIPVP